MRVIIATLVLLCATSATASELTWGFKNPRFSGQGYSSHVLSTEQLQHNRKADIEAKAEAEARRIAR